MIALNRFDLTPYRMRMGLNVITGIVIVSVAFALAGLTWRLAGHADTGAITVPAIKRAVPVPDMAPALALAPFGRPVGSDAASPTTLPLKLTGIVFARPESLSSAFISANGEPARAFRVGEAVGGATIQTIQVNRVLILNGGRVESLDYPDPFAGVAGAAPTPVPTVAPGAPPPAAPSQDAAQLLQRLDATPAAGGYRIGANAPPGLREGDVVSQVNGAALSSPDAARDAFARAQSAGTAQIVVTRDGKPVTITVPIR